MMVDFLQKYNVDSSIDIHDCHQERPLLFFHTVAGHLSEGTSKNEEKRGSGSGRDSEMNVEKEEREEP